MLRHPAAQLLAAADLKISQLTDGSTIQTTDQVPVNRGGANRRLRHERVGRRPVPALVMLALQRGRGRAVGRGGDGMGVGHSCTRRIAVGREAHVRR